MCATFWWGFRLGPSTNLKRIGPPHYPRPSWKWKDFWMWSEKSWFKKENKFPHKKARHVGEWNQGQDTLKEEKPKQFQGSRFKPKGNFVKKGAPLKGGQPKGDASGKPKGACFDCNKMGHYSKDCPKPKPGNGGSKVIAFTIDLSPRWM
jgi:hypothetical protein